MSYTTVCESLPPRLATGCRLKQRKSKVKVLKLLILYLRGALTDKVVIILKCRHRIRVTC